MPIIETELDIRANPAHLQQIVALLRDVEAQVRRVQALGPVVPPTTAAVPAPARAGVVPPTTAAAPAPTQAAAGPPIAPMAGGEGAVPGLQAAARAAAPVADVRPPVPDTVRQFLAGFGARERQSLAAAAGVLAQQLVSHTTDAFARSVYGGMAAEAAGLAAGTPFAAARGVLERERTERMAAIEYQRGVGGAAGGMLFAAAGVSAAAGALPAAIGLAIAGAATTAISSVLATRAQQMTESEIRVRESALQALESRYGARMGQVPHHMALGRAGVQWTTGLEEQLRAGERLGIGYGGMLQRMAASVQGGGVALPPEFVAALEARYGVQAATLARITRPFRPGYGLAGGERVSEAAIIGNLQAAVQAGVEAGIADTDMPRYLEAMAAYNQRMAERGIAVAPESWATLVGAAATGGLRGRAAEALPERLRDLGMQARETLASALFPRDVLSWMAIAGAYRRRLPGQGLMDILATLEQPTEVYEGLREQLQRLPADVRTLAFVGMGLGAGAARGMAAALPAPTEPVAPETRDLPDLVTRVTTYFSELGHGTQVAAAAEAAHAETLADTAVEWQRTAAIAKNFGETIAAVNDVMHALADEELARGIARLRTELARLTARAREERR